MRNKIILEQRESEIKTSFFTNISHEIRTPLTMIVSPIDNIIQNESTPEPIKKQLKLVSKNASRLLNMVNQILDFQKIEQSNTLSITILKLGRISKIFSTTTKKMPNYKISTIPLKITSGQKPYGLIPKPSKRSS
jgi:signal transduction histidine kinase